MMQSARAACLLAILALVAAGCATVGVAPVEVGWSDTGYASWCGESLQGQRTASGEPFDRAKLTAAHRTLPFGTYVEVTRLDDGRSVVVRVNDRGPFVHGRIIDISEAAARKLGMIREGVVKVRIRVVR